MEKVEIMMYTMPTCGYCAKMKGELEKSNITYTEKNYKDNKEEWEHIKSLTRSAVFPTFVVGKEYLIPNRDFKNPQEAIQSLQYYQNSMHRDQTIEDLVELLKNNMYMTKMALDKIEAINVKLTKQEKVEAQNAIQEDRKEHLEQQKKIMDKIRLKKTIS
jgi:glutaredoxin